MEPADATCARPTPAGPRRDALVPTISVVKTANPTEVMEPGDDVTFTVAVGNASSASDPVTIDSLTDM